jgi:hypothetical protein
MWIRQKGKPATGKCDRLGNFGMSYKPDFP